MVLESAEAGQKDFLRYIDFGTEIRNARVDLDKAIEAIQKIAGYEDFFRPSTFERVKHDLLENSSSAGVYLLITSTGGLGLIMHSNGVEAVWLDDFNELMLDEMLVKQEGGKFIGGY